MAEIPWYQQRQGLSQICFSRFKAFEHTAFVDLAPVTLIAGVNSGGKSTILQSLLMARQTLLAPYRSTQEPALIYDGDLVSFGEFNELLYGKPATCTENDLLHLGFTVQYRHTFPPYFDDKLADEWYKKGRHVYIHLDVHFAYNADKKAVEVFQAILYSSIPGGDTGDIQGPKITIEQSNESFEWAAWDMSLEMGNGQDTQKGTLPNGFFDRFVPEWKNDQPVYHPLPDGRRLPVWYEAEEVFKELFTPALDLLRYELTDNLYYLGPLRSAPQRPYIRRSIVGLDIGRSGEYTVQQLHEHWEEETPFVNLPDDGTFAPETIQPETMTVGTAVHKALVLLGLEQHIKIERLGQSYETSVSLLSAPETYVAITEVGFGVSQILPVIALGLLSPANSLLLFEQPEIHLHPRAQAGLADFLLCLARSGRRVLVETHSDHFIKRLRRRLAEDTSNQFEGAVSMLFVLPPESGENGARVVQGHIDRYGRIDNWPSGFLAESAMDARAVMIASSQKRIRDRELQQAGSKQQEPATQQVELKQVG